MSLAKKISAILVVTMKTDGPGLDQNKIFIKVSSFTKDVLEPWKR